MDVVSTGEIFRTLASERGVSLERFGDIAEGDETIDRELDDRVVKMAEGGKIMEGRLTGHLLSESDKDAFKVWIHADQDIRVKRITEREGEPLSEVGEKVEKRERSERKRYMEYYDIDLADRSIYDIIIDSGENSPEEVVEAIMEGLKDELD